MYEWNKTQTGLLLSGQDIHFSHLSDAFIQSDWVLHATSRQGHFNMLPSAGTEPPTHQFNPNNWAAAAKDQNQQCAFIFNAELRELFCSICPSWNSLLLILRLKLTFLLIVFCLFLVFVSDDLNKMKTHQDARWTRRWRRNSELRYEAYRKFVFPIYSQSSWAFVPHVSSNWCDEFTRLFLFERTHVEALLLIGVCVSGPSHHVGLPGLLYVVRGDDDGNLPRLHDLHQMLPDPGKKGTKPMISCLIWWGSVRLAS